MKDKDNYNEILHWLAINYPGIYRIWSNEKDQEDFMRAQMRK